MKFKRRRGQSLWTNGESWQTNSDAREKHRISENFDAEKIDEHCRMTEPAPYTRAAQSWLSGCLHANGSDRTLPEIPQRERLLATTKHFSDSSPESLNRFGRTGACDEHGNIRPVQDAAR